LSIFKKRENGVRSSGTVKVGWLMSNNEGPTFIWPEPRQIKTERRPDGSPHSVGVCPGIIDYESRLFEVTCPVDLAVQLKRNSDGQLMMVLADGYRGMLTNRRLQKMTILMGPKEWRHEKRPVFQLRTPYRFISDDHVYFNQLPPFLSYEAQKRPGMMIGGRFPIDVWPRSLLWAFEWWEPEKPLIIRRGEPLFYARFETTEPSKKVRLVQAEMTPELEQQCKGLDGVANYVDQTFSLFNVARSRRPKQLLVEKKLD
jgi:hypothetical protein